MGHVQADIANINKLLWLAEDLIRQTSEGLLTTINIYHFVAAEAKACLFNFKMDQRIKCGSLAFQLLNLILSVVFVILNEYVTDFNNIYPSFAYAIFMSTLIGTLVYCVCDLNKHMTLFV